MSDNVSGEEQQQQMGDMPICADVWLELISDRFDVLVDEHFKLRKWSLGSLDIRRATDGSGAEIVNSSGEQLPLPQGPIPNKVIGFERIWISYVDQTVIKFLQRIRPLFDSSGTNVEIGTSHFADQSRSGEIICQKIWPFVNDNIRRLPRLDPSGLNLLRQFSPTILRRSANLRSIDFRGLSPAFPAKDNFEASDEQAMAKWLITQRKDGLPKMLHCRFYSEGMERLKRAFVNALKPVNFIIKYWIYGGEGVPFELENNLTAERLTLRQMDNKYFWLLVRCPIGREEAKWREWEEEAFQLDFCRQSNCLIYLNINDWDIDDGMLDANDEGPSEPKK
ncbi:hypothetical protein GPALN_003127 [Globodera pallida]|nr:hypothetical protein GPALN_003127 [Globodera pallida]